MQRSHVHLFFPSFYSSRLRIALSLCAALAIVLSSILIGPGTAAFAQAPAPQICQESRLIAAVARPGDPLAEGSGIGLTNTVYFMTPYSSTNPLGQCTALQTGAIWGLAYGPYQGANESAKLYMSAAMIAGAGFGTLGSGGIYRSDDGKPATTQPFVDLDALGLEFTTRPANFPSNAARGLTGNPQASWLGALGQIILDNQRQHVGRMSLGDIDIVTSQNVLWTVNLFDRSLIRINVPANGINPTASNITSIKIPAPTQNGDSICIRDEYRPWGLKVMTDTVYVGVTCTDEGRTELPEPGEDVNPNVRGVIYKYTVASNTWTPLTISANGQENPYFPMKGYRWDHPNPNNNAYNRQLFIADIEIDEDGSFILGMGDRWPMMGSDTLGLNNQPWSAGDIVRICNANGALSLENNGTCPNGGGNGGTEYYNDRPEDPAFQNNHKENQTGGIALVPPAAVGGQSLLVSMAYNPLIDSGAGNRSGFQVFNNQDGQIVASRELVQAANEYGYGKAGGLGDVEVLCDFQQGFEETEEPSAPHRSSVYLPMISTQ